MDYTDFISKLDNAHQYRNYITADCPFQDWVSHNPPFFVNERGYNCVSCGAHGSLEWLAKKLGGHYRKTGHVKRVVVLPKWQKWVNDYGSIQGIADAAHSIYNHMEGKRLFFRQRQIDQFSNQGYFGWLDGWNLFPIFSPDGHIIDIVVRGGDGTGGMRYVLRPDEEREHPYLYVPDWDAVRGAETVYVPFGIIDAWAFYAINRPVITGTAGKAISAETLWNLGKKYIIVPDYGEEDAARDLRNQLGWKASVHVLRYPAGCKDPDEIRRKYDNIMLVQCLAERSIE